MQKVFKARGLNEVTKEKRGDPRTKHGCFEIRNIKKNLQRPLKRCRQQEFLPWKTCEEKVFLGGKVNKMLIFSLQIKKMEDFDVTIGFVNIEVTRDHHRSSAKGMQA